MPSPSNSTLRGLPDAATFQPDRIAATASGRAGGPSPRGSHELATLDSRAEPARRPPETSPAEATDLSEELIRSGPNTALLRHARSSRSHASALALQRLAGNRAASRLVAHRSPIQRVGAIITAQAKSGTSAHPTLTKGGTNNPEAVTEAQQKLATSPGGPTTLTANGVFTDETETAVKAFQKKNGKTESGIVDKATWDLLDAQGKSSVGRVEREWEETLDGTTYGMTSKYSYKIDSTKILVTVGINFVADSTSPPADVGAVVGPWKRSIYAKWNQFQAVKDGSTEKRDIEFEIVSSGGNTVNVINEDGQSDAGNWYVQDMVNYPNVPAHEFGHMIGLADEYKQSETEYRRLHPGASESSITAAKGATYGGDQYTNEGSMMGMGSLKDHPDRTDDPEPRHVREFVSFVEKFLGGTWEAKKK